MNEEIEPGKYYWIWIDEEPEPALYYGEDKWMIFGLDRTVNLAKKIRIGCGVGDEIKCGKLYEEFYFDGALIY